MSFYFIFQLYIVFLFPISLPLSPIRDIGGSQYLEVAFQQRVLAHHEGIHTVCLRVQSAESIGMLADDVN
jgi:hypothetical protein